MNLQSDHPVSDGTYRIVSLVNDQRVGVAHPHTPQVHTGNALRTEWEVRFNLETRHYIIHERNGDRRVLDLERALPDPGTRIITYSHHGNENQQWHLFGTQE